MWRCVDVELWRFGDADLEMCRWRCVDVGV